MVECLFHPGDKVQMKSCEEVIELIHKYFRGNNPSYEKSITELCDGIYTVKYTGTEQFIKPETYSVYMKESITHTGWKLLQDYFVHYEEYKTNNDIPDLFG